MGPLLCEAVCATRHKYRMDLDVQSPRTLEAILHVGLEACELLPASSTKKQRGSAAVTQRRGEFFEKRRQDKLSMVAAKRDEIVAGVLSQTHGAASSSARTVGVPPADDEAAESGPMVASMGTSMDEKRMEATKKRQAKELARLVLGEQRTAQLQQKILHSEREEKLRALEHEKKVKLQRTAVESQKKARSDRQAELDAEKLHHARELVAKEKARDVEIRAKEEASAKRHAELLKAHDLERSAKAAEQLRKSETALEQIFAAAESSATRMLAREVALKAVLEEKALKKKFEAAELREKSDARIAKAVEHQKAKQRAEREMFAKRGSDAAARARAKFEEDLVTAEKQQKARTAQDKVRKERLDDALRRRKDRREAIVEHRDHKEQYYATVTTERLSQLEMLRLEGELDNVARLENVARIRRVDEFQRLQLLHKTQLDDARAARFKYERAVLVDQRKDAAHEAFLRKSRVREAMQQMAISNKYTDLSTLVNPGNSRKLQPLASDSGHHSESAPAL